jgi:hypothetical protein
MKFRSGFVSNSSSSSFVYLFPDDFDVNKIDWEKFDFTDYAAEACYDDAAEVEDDGNPVEAGSEENMKADIVKGLKKFFKEKELWYEEDGSICTAIEMLFSDYVIAEIDGGPEDGKVILADKAKVKKILGVA